MRADLFAPFAMADLVALQHWQYRPLFEYLAKRFDYILRLSEDENPPWVPDNVDPPWDVSLWHDLLVTAPKELGIAGDLGERSWTITRSLRDATEIAAQAANVLRQRGCRVVFVFHPGKCWHSGLTRLNPQMASTAPEGAA